MLFNSIDFAIFLPIVFVLYWFVTNRSLKTQNLLLLIASYVFYGWWDWRFLLLIFASSLTDFLVGKGISNSNELKEKKILLAVSIVANLGLLGFFKYYNFFAENFVAAFTIMGSPIRANSLNIILPVGISFYTFQTLSYTIDVYRGKIAPTSNIISFLAFVSFFPQLVAGPIERATNLLPQFSKARIFNFDSARDGLRQLLWGLFKKIVVADNAAEYANMAFSNDSTNNGSTLALGAFFFAIQIYGDFSGYSDMAIGISKLFGFKLTRNFNNPYFSRNIGEFWRKWHISLTTWFRDYVYIPLGGSRVSNSKKIRNILIVFILSAFWHGANWTFIAWGAVHAIYFLPSIIGSTNRRYEGIVAAGKILPNPYEFLRILYTFTIVTLAWIFFRAESMEHAFTYFKGIFNSSLIEVPMVNSRLEFYTTLISIILMFVFEWINREKPHGLNLDSVKRWGLRWVIYLILIFVIFWLGNSGQEFIYFQF